MPYAPGGHKSGMSQGEPAAVPRAARPELERELRRVVDRLAGLSPAQLAAPVGAHPSRVAAGRSLARALADAAAELEGGPARPLPVLRETAVADQVAVTGNDLLAAAPGPAATLEQALEQVRELRRLL